MKYVKLLLLNVLILLAGKSAEAQEIKDSTLFFYIAYSMQPPPNDRSGYVDTLKITYSNQDTVAFDINGSSFVKVGEKVSLLENSDTVLLYDYSLTAGDTFVLNYYGEYSLQVDSVKDVQYQDGNTYKEWHLHDIGEPLFGIVWVENLGAKGMGWNWTYYRASHYAEVKAICFNGDLIYWTISQSDFHPNAAPSPTCDFDSLLGLLSGTKAKELRDNTVYFTITVYDGTYPNILTGGADTLKITYSSQDTVAFTVGAEGFISYLKVGEKISCIRLHSPTYRDTILLYDYSLAAGDTFNFNQSVVDSVVYAEYLDGEIYREWHLHRIDYPAAKTVWIETMGTKNRMWGWDYISGIPEYTSYLKVICYDNELIYWKDDYPHFPNGDPNPTCDFDFLRDRLSVSEIVKKQISVYPNPAQTELFVDEIPANAEFRILNVVGAEVKKGVVEGGSVSVSDLSQGVYLLQIRTSEQVYQARFVKE